MKTSALIHFLPAEVPAGLTGFETLHKPVIVFRLPGVAGQITQPVARWWATARAFRMSSSSADSVIFFICTKIVCTLTVSTARPCLSSNLERKRIFPWACLRQSLDRLSIYHCRLELVLRNLVPFSA